MRSGVCEGSGTGCRGPFPRLIRLVEIATGRTLARLESPDLCGVQAVAFSPDGSRLVVTTNDGPAAHVWDLRLIRRRLAAMGLDWDAPPYPDTYPAGETSRRLANIVVDLGPFKPELQPLLQQARQLEQNGDVGGAIDRLRQAVRVSPNYAEAHNSLAWLLLTTPCAASSTRSPACPPTREIELHPGEQLSLNTLGVALYRTGRFAEAIEALEKSLNASGDELAAFDLSLPGLWLTVD